MAPALPPSHAGAPWMGAPPLHARSPTSLSFRSPIDLVEEVFRRRDARVPGQRGRDELRRLAWPVAELLREDLEDGAAQPVLIQGLGRRGLPLRWRSTGLGERELGDLRRELGDDVLGLLRSDPG